MVKCETCGRRRIGKKVSGAGRAPSKYQLHMKTWMAGFKSQTGERKNAKEYFKAGVVAWRNRKSTAAIKKA